MCCSLCDDFVRTDVCSLLDNEEKCRTPLNVRHPNVCWMDAMVVNEAIRHGLQINEVDGTRSVVANLEGVIFQIILKRD
ncbi:hypothetical protein GW17_00049292 [Ensete ventricosum]|uniref:Uncharacterized protein n=1 Tax=Ensete ventricosum TaxID=4639 RepID=A0A444CRT7_ENSVE|nr:hypothetical protein GW17_00049292 [Ensete ventricosum]RZR73434.1 hypothetical protein BHM03_00024187 [Ensete ventricosum]